MTMKLNIPNERLFQTILQFLNRFTKEGLEIVTEAPIHQNGQFHKIPPQKGLPEGFWHPIQVESYDGIASRDVLHER